LRVRRARNHFRPPYRFPYNPGSSEQEEARVYDVISVAIVLGFFALCVAYVYGCERILGREDTPVDVPESTHPPAATADSVAA
jgi:hypothetical protein